MKRWTWTTWAFVGMWISYAMFVLSCSAHGQQLLTIQKDVSIPKLTTGWRTMRPLRQVNDPSLRKYLADIVSHVPASGVFQHADIGTVAHETTHEINSLVRNESGAGANAFYCLSNRVAVLREPRLKLADVAAYVPTNLRGDQYQQYLVTAQRPPQPGMEGWNDNPLYVLDEWVAYINGCYVEQEHYGAAKTTPSGFLIGHNVNSAIQFCGYATALLRCVESQDPTYPDREKLADFISFNIDRSLALTRLHPERECVEKFALTHFQGGMANCIDGSCGDVQWSGGRFIRQPSQQWRPAQPQAKPVPPKPQPPAVAGCKCGDCCKENAALIVKLEARILALENKVADGSLKGPPGPAGKDGMAGEPGPRGQQGPPGLTQSPASIVSLPVRVIRPNGEHEDASVLLDGRHRLDINLPQTK